jgi:NADPH-dependent curcumin reductase CurA
LLYGWRQGGSDRRAERTFSGPRKIFDPLLKIRSDDGASGGEGHRLCYEGRSNPPGMAEMKNRQWLLARRPDGALKDSDFTFVETEAPAPGEGEVLVRTLMLSCDPTQRTWIAMDTYLPAVKIGEVVRSGGAGRVEASNDPGFAVGDVVFGQVGWQDYVVMNPKGLTKLPNGTPLELAMSALGMIGITAYFGLIDVGRPVAGETVVVSGAAGATGSLVGQIARIKGCRAIGVAGGMDKCRWLTDELGFDAAIDYKSENVKARLKELCPKGVDIFFDNVGGPILDAALARLAMRGRVVLCGGIAAYDAAEPPPGPKNYLNLVSKRGRMEGFLVFDYMPRAAEAIGGLSGWVKAGELKYRVDVQHGLENAPATLRRLFEGLNEGKQLLRVAE